MGLFLDDGLGDHHPRAEIGRFLTGPEHAGQRGHHKETDRGEYGQADDQLNYAKSFSPHPYNFYLQRWFFLESGV